VSIVKSNDAKAMKTFAYMIPDPRKNNTLGEDAYFVHNSWAAIADGVGGWRSHGIDPGRFSRALVEAMRKVVINLSKESHDLESSAGKGADKIARMNQVIKWGFQDVLDSQKRLWEITENAPGKSRPRQNIIQGSSTVLLYHLDTTSSSIMATNIGDCELLVLRRLNSAGDNNNNNNNNNDSMHSQASYAIVDRVHAGCFSFNMPYQIGIQIAYERIEKIDSPKVLSKKIKVQSGDIIVAGSDGLFDNVFEDEIVKYVSLHANMHLRRSENNDYSVWNRLAIDLAKLAIKYGKDRKYNSPFSIKASESGDMNLRGGKLDDTTVLISYIE
jgi:protein phosphatase PTC7